MAKLQLLILVFYLCNCRGEESSTYTAAVVELYPTKFYGDGSITSTTKQIVDIIESPEIVDVDILVLPEAVLNSQHTAILLPTSTSFCSDPNAHPTLRDISCAVKRAGKYVVIDLYAKVSCSDDDQPFCANEVDSTNTYNMAIVFDRHGEMIAKYRKYHLFVEHGVQKPQKPDLTTFETDFNVTFGVFICFDLMFEEPAITLASNGVAHFVYPTMWYSEIPYLTAAQFQQSWAYANNVNLLAANVNWPKLGVSGSGIFAGRYGALRVHFSETARTKILIAKVPRYLPGEVIEYESPNLELLQNTISQNFPQYETCEQPSDCNEDDSSSNNGLFFDAHESVEQEFKLFQDNLTEYTVQFLDFAKELSQEGTVCNKGICCNYSVEVSENGRQVGKASYSYAIAVFDGLRGYEMIKNLFTGQQVCSLIACTEMNAKNSCGKRIAPRKLGNHFIINKLELQAVLPISNMKVMPNTLSNALVPLSSKEFQYQLLRLEGEQYLARLRLKVPKTDLITLAIFSRNYSKDIIQNKSESK